MIKGKIKNGKIVMAKPHKYKAKPVIVDGFKFDSTLEGKRFSELKLLQQAGEISELVIHPQFLIRWPGSEAKIGIVELDFQYLDAGGKLRIEDVKGHDTALSKLKRKLVQAAFNIEVELIFK